MTGLLQDLLGPSILTQVPNDTTQFNAVNDLTGAQYQGTHLCSHAAAQPELLPEPLLPAIVSALHLCLLDARCPCSSAGVRMEEGAAF